MVLLTRHLYGRRTCFARRESRRRRRATFMLTRADESSANYPLMHNIWDLSTAEPPRLGVLRKLPPARVTFGAWEWTPDELLTGHRPNTPTSVAASLSRRPRISLASPQKP
jgi:hypothetical protein